jgi:hypothetical protein
MFVKKFAELTEDAAYSQGMAGDAHTNIFVQTDIPNKTSAGFKVYTVAANILTDPKDKKSGHPATVEEIKAEVTKRSGLPPSEQRLVYKGVELKEGTDISDYSIPANGAVMLNPTKRQIKIKARAREARSPENSTLMQTIRTRLMRSRRHWLSPWGCLFPIRSCGLMVMSKWAALV